MEITIYHFFTFFVVGIELARDISNASVTGLRIGSTEIEFQPYELKGGEFTADTKTAG